MSEKCTRPHQTGMEPRWERWVLDTLNFLQGLDIPFYARDREGKRTGVDLEIPDRLKALRHMIAGERAAAAKNTLELVELKKRVAVFEELIQTVHDALVPADGARCIEAVAQLAPHIPKKEPDVDA